MNTQLENEKKKKTEMKTQLEIWEMNAQLQNEMKKTLQKEKENKLVEIKNNKKLQEKMKNLYITEILKFPSSETYLFYYYYSDDILFKEKYKELKDLKDLKYNIYFNFTKNNYRIPDESKYNPDYEKKYNIDYVKNNDKNYTIGRYYKFNDIIFKCINIIIKKDKETGFDFNIYDIYFKYIGDEIEMNEEIKVDNSREKLIEYGIVKHRELFKFYNRTSSYKTINIFNSDIKIGLN
jgi:hypothetical protein